MHTTSHQFNSAVQIRLKLLLNELFHDHGLEPHSAAVDLQEEAFTLGFESSGTSIAVETLMASSQVRSHFEDGKRLSSEKPYLPTPIELICGTWDEWNALSPQDRGEQWDRYHELCQQGVGDTLYFYPIMSSIFMKGYVGH